MADELAVALRVLRRLSPAQRAVFSTGFEALGGGDEEAGLPRSGSTANAELGKAFMRRVGLLLGILVTIYIALHFWIPVELTAREPEELIRVDQFGFATVVSVEDLAWQVGEEKAGPLTATLNSRNERVVALRNELDVQLRRAEQSLAGALREDPFPFLALIQRESSAALTHLASKINAVSRALSTATLQGANDQALHDLRLVVHQLQQIRSDQLATRTDARPPQKFMLFWMNPYGVLAEALFWALFGVCISLVFHTARALSTQRPEDEFRPIERWVGISKLIYCPVVTAALVFALWLGLVEIGGPETRSWSLPLLGVLIGFNIRKAVDVLDHLSHWLLDRFRTSSARTDAQRRADNAGRFSTLLQPKLHFLPKTLSDIKTEARLVASTLAADALKNKLP